MTTTVVIQLPKPNHENVRVRLQHRNATGEWVDSANEVTLDHGESHVSYVYGSQRVVIEEVEKPVAAPPPAPRPVFSGDFAADGRVHA